MEPRVTALFDSHCRARLDKQADPRGNGRCIYQDGHHGDHALLRGDRLVHWATTWTFEREMADR